MVAGVHLRRTLDRDGEIDALAAALSGERGARVGLAGVLTDLNRRARVARVPGRAATWGFRWDEEDERSQRWWPQGITTSADHDESEEYGGHRMLLTSWYSQDLAGVNKGSRITVVDLTGESQLRYRHVLLVAPFTRDDGEVDVRPLKAHAGGIVWYGDHLHVAGTARGISTCRLDDIVRVEDLGDSGRLGLHRGSFGYRYLLPVRFTYEGLADDGAEPMRYSFLSLDRSSSEPRLVAGEYGRNQRTTRLVEYGIDPETSLLRIAEDDVARPLALTTEGLEGMQGATVVDGRWYVTTSSGRFLGGSLYVGRPGSFRRRARVLPAGVEDIAYWRSRDELWSLSEYPGRRYVFAMDRSKLG